MKNSVLLINPHPRMHLQGKAKGIIRHSPELPMSIAFLAAYLEEQGMPVACLDLAVSSDPAKQLRAALEETRPRYIGVTSLSAAMPGASRVAETCREILGTDAVLIMGGLHATSIKERFLEEYPLFDYLVFGEGEVTLVELIRHLQAALPVDEIMGLGHRKGGRSVLNPPRPFLKDFDVLPFPARHLLPIKAYTPSLHTGNHYRLPSTGIITSRGCPYECRYCSKGVWGRTIRFRSARRILAEMVHCVEKYGIRDFRFYDDAITLPGGPVLELCDLLIQSRLDVTWNCYSRVNCVTPEMLGRMKKAGCYHIKYGIEFGTEKALSIANKRSTLEQARRAVAWTKEAGIECKGNFFMGLPGETLEDCQKTVDFAVELSPDMVSFGVFEFIPGSHFYKQLHSDDGAALADACLPRKDLYSLAARAHLRFYLRFGYLLQVCRRFIRNPARETLKNLAGAMELYRYFVSRIKKKESNHAHTTRQRTHEKEQQHRRGDRHRHVAPLRPDVPGRLSGRKVAGRR